MLSAGLLVLAAPSQAAERPAGARSFKVVKPPAPGTRKRITVSIAPRDPPAPRAPAEAAAARHGWFWTLASPARAAADPERLLGLAALSAGRIGPGRAAEVAAAWRAEIAAAARGAKVSEALLAALVAAESGGDPRAVSRAGAQGLGQLIPATARRFGVADPFDPKENLRGAAEYLSELLGMFGEDAVLALAAYNAGENAVIRHEGVPPYAETRDYVPIVLANFEAARRLCLPAPARPRDACLLLAAPGAPQPAEIETADAGEGAPGGEVRRPAAPR